MTFRVGQKVVCVDASAIQKAVPLNEGAVYTIRTIIPLRSSVRGCGIYLVEIVNLLELGLEVGYFSDRFRPAVERKTDISIFTAMLKPSKVDA